MKRKSLILFVITVLIAAFAFGCGKSYKFDPYDKFTGVNEGAVLAIDDYVTLDGVLDEDIWANSKTAINIAGATIDNMTKQPIDVEEYGERSATVYTYIGEKAVYFAFDVIDQNLYYNSQESQGSSTCVELYFTNETQSTLSEGCYSIRINPTGKEGKDSVKIGTYVPTLEGNEWSSRRMRGKVDAASTVEGSIMNNAGDTTYDKSKNVGYVVEIAVDKELIGGEGATAMQYTAAFVQDRGFELKRLNNSMIAGTSYIGVGSWKLVTNDGVIPDKNAYFDASVTPDDGVIIDGKFDDGIWANVQGRTVEATDYKNKNNETIKTTTYAVTTEKGIYIGLESNDSAVYYHDGYRAVYNTGAEVLITAGKADKVNGDTSMQFRFNVGGSGQRYRGRLANEDQMEDPKFYPYIEQYFPAKVAGQVIADADDEGINTGNSDGWTGEIFIPWTALNMEDYDYRNGVAVMTCAFKAFPLGTLDDKGDQKRNYLAPVAAKVYGSGSQVCNPQNDFFLFENGKPVYKPVTIHNVTMDGVNLVSGEDSYYAETISVQCYDDVVTNGKFKELFPEVTGGQFSFGVDGVTVDDNGDGTYLIKVPEDKATEFAQNKTVTATFNGVSSNFALGIDTDFELNGVLDEAAWASVNSFTTNQTDGKVVDTEFKVLLEDNAMYIGATVTDTVYAKTADYRDPSNEKVKNVGLELYFNFGDELSSANTYQVRLLSNDVSGRYYNYLDVENGDGWSWGPINYVNEIKKVFTVVGETGYRIEARIPYSVFGLDAKPESVEIATLTNYLKNDGGTNAVKLFSLQGNALSRDHALYLNYDETGFAPNKLVMRNAIDARVSTIELVDGIGIDTASDSYVGSAKLSLLPNGILPIMDADFGAFDSYINKDNAVNGVYAYSIPTAAFSTTNTITIPVTTATYGFDTQIVINLNEFNQIYIDANGRDKVQLWPVDIVNESNSDFYEISLKLYADERHYIPLNSADLVVTFSVDGVDGVTATAVNNEYTVLIPYSELQPNADYTLKVTGGGVDGEINFRTNEFANPSELYNNALMFLDFEGNSYANKVGHTGVTSMRRGPEDISGGVYTMNQAQRALQVSGIELGNSFTFSALVNGSDIKKLWDAHYANTLFATGNVDSKTGYFTDGTIPFFIGVRSSVLYVKVDKGKIDLNAALEKVSTGFERWTFTVSRAENIVTVNMYIDGEFAAGGSCEVSETHDFNNVDKIIGIGAPARYDDKTNPADYIASGDKASNHDIRLDNIILYNGIMSVDAMNAVDGYSREITKMLDWTVTDIAFDFSHTMNNDSIEREIVITHNAGGNTEGAVITGLPEGVSADTTVGWDATEGKYLLKIAEADYGKFTADKNVELTVSLNGGTGKIRVIYTPLTELVADRVVTLYDYDKASDKYTFDIKITDATGAVGIAGVTFADGWTATAGANAGEYTVEVAATVLEAQATHSVALSKVVDSETVEGTITVNYVVWNADRIAEITESYIDFNGYAFDRKGNTVTAVGNNAFVTGADGTPAARLQTAGSSKYMLGKALGANDFTMSFDVKLDSAAMPDNVNTNAGYEMISSGSSIDEGTDTAADTFQLSAQRRNNSTPAYTRQFRFQLGKNNNDQRFSFNIDAAWLDTWINITLVVDRDVEVVGNTEKAKAYVYINGEVIDLWTGNFPDTEIEKDPNNEEVAYQLTYDVADQAIGSNTLHIGGNLTWMLDRQMWMDNFIILNRALDAKQIAAIGDYTDRETTASAWTKSDDIVFDFNRNGATAYTDSITLTKRADADPFEGVTFSDNIKDYIGTPSTAGLATTYPITIPRANYDDFIGGVVATVTVNGIAKPIRITYLPQTAQAASLLANAQAYIDFEDGFENAVANGNSETYFLTGEASAEANRINGTYFFDQKNHALQLSNFSVKKDFTVSLMVDGDSFIERSGTSNHVTPIIATGKIDSDVKFLIGARYNRIYVKVGDQAPTFSTNTAEIKAAVSGWRRWTFTVHHESATEIKVTMYIDGVKFKDTITVTVPAGHELDNDQKVIGIGATAINRETNYQNRKGFRIGDYILYNGIMDVDTMNALNDYASILKSNLNYTASDIAFDYTDTMDNDSVSYELNLVHNDGASIEGATVTGLPDGVSAGTKVEWNAALNDYVLTIAKADYGKFTEEKNVELTVNLNGGSAKVHVIYTPLTALVADGNVTLYDYEKASDKYTFDIKITDATGAVGIEGVTFADGWTATAGANAGEYTVEVAATVLEAQATHSVALSKVVGSDTVEGTLTVNFIEWNADRIAESAMYYYDLNGIIVDRAGSSTGSLLGSGHEWVTGDDGTQAIQTKSQRSALVEISNAPIGANDFTISYDVKLNKADMGSGTTQTNASYAMVESGSNIAINQDATSGQTLYGDNIQIAARRQATNNNNKDDSEDKYDYNFRIQLGNNGGNVFTYNLTEAEESTLLDNWINVAVTVDRDYANTASSETVYAVLYINGVEKARKEMTYTYGSGYTQDQALGNGKFWLGGYLDWQSAKRMQLDNFVVLNRALKAEQLFAIGDYTDRETKASAWTKSSDIAFDFTQDGATEYASSITLTKRADSDPLEGVTFSDNIKDFIGTPSTAGLATTYPIAIPRANYADFIGGVDATVTVNGVAKSFRIIYTPISAVYFNNVALNTQMKSAGAYTFSVQAYADSAKTYKITDITFPTKEGWTFEKQSDGSYIATVTEAAMEGENGASISHTIEASYTSSSTTVNGSFTVSFTKLGGEELVANAKVYLNFDEETTSGETVTFANLGNDSTVTAKMLRGTTVLNDGGDYATDKSYVAAQRKRSLGLEGLSVGTGSFSVAMMINGKTLLENLPGDGYAQMLFGTYRIDNLKVDNVNRYYGFSVRMRRNAMQIYMSGNECASVTDTSGLDEVKAAVEEKWQPWVFVFDRETAGKTTIRIYIDNEQIYSITKNTGSATFDNTKDPDNREYMFGIGAPGSATLAESTTAIAAGSDATGYYNGSFELDDFMVYDGVLDKWQASAFDDFIELKNAAAMQALDIKAADVHTVYTADTDYVATLDIKYSDGSKVVGATFSENVADYITEADGIYTLTVPVANLIDFVGGVDATVTKGDASDSFNISLVSQTMLAGIADATTLYMPLDGNLDNDVKDSTVYASMDKAKIESGATTETQTEASFDSGSLGRPFYTANMYKRALTAKNIGIDKNDFAVSVDIDGDTFGKLGTGSYMNVLFGTGQVDTPTAGEYGFTVRIRKNALGIKMGVTGGSASQTVDSNLTVDGVKASMQSHVDAGRLMGWHRWTFVFDRSEDMLTVNTYIYIDAELAYTFTHNVAADYSLANAKDTLGIGNRGTFEARPTSGEQEYIQCYGNSGSSGTRDIRLTNFTYINKALSHNEVKTLNAFGAEHYAAVLQ